MATPELIEKWQTIDADLRRARRTLPPEADSNSLVLEFQDFLNHNELELACDMLEAYGDSHPVSREFWLALRDASMKMKLPERVTRYDSLARAMPFIRPTIRSMSGYTPGEQVNRPDIVKLNTNENPYPPSPRVIEAIQSTLTANSLRKYPQPFGDEFRKAAGDVLKVDPDSILIGNGSDDLLTILTRTFVPEGGRIVSPTPSYSLYKSLADIQGATFETVPFQPDWSLPSPWPKPGANLTFLPNPNSPSGTCLPIAAVERFVAEADGPVVLDEAYADFAEWNGLALPFKNPNVVVTRTFSKYYALAGIRFGFLVADPALVREFGKVKDSYNCDVLSLAAAAAAIRDQSYYAGLRAKILATRERMTAALIGLGFVVTPSAANFVWCRRERPVKPVYEALKAAGILVRYMTYPGYGDGLRISVGTDEEIDRLLAELSRIG
jgi:histidinol-phosphate aminotransferase